MSATDLHATCRSRVWGFVDDLRFTPVSDRRMITVHSAARAGIVDFGVNRQRVGLIRWRWIVVVDAFARAHIHVQMPPHGDSGNSRPST